VQKHQTPGLCRVLLDEAGQVIALVGENGSAKTTFAKLLSRLYLPQAGRIRWDGVDIADLDPAQVHRRIAVIFQDFARLTGGRLHEAPMPGLLQRQLGMVFRGDQRPVRMAFVRPCQLP
jgi:ABC-type siderophore export system fused ATPase/permease subunit